MFHKHFFGPYDERKPEEQVFAMKFDDVRNVLIIGCYRKNKLLLEEMVREVLKMPLPKERRPCVNKVRYSFRMNSDQFLKFKLALGRKDVHISETVDSLGRIFR